jgi:predicted TIM-barrel fold metal-dependent hydrolase
MAFRGTKVIDLDNHLSDDVPSWEHWIDPAWKAKLPKRIPTAIEERSLTQVGDQVMEESSPGTVQHERPAAHSGHAATPKERVALLDQAGIDIAVLSPNSPALNYVWFPQDPKLAAAYCRAQNNYMHDFASQYPDRLTWAGVIPMQDVDEAITELHRAADLGMKGLNQKSTLVQGREWWDPYFDPIFRELQNLHMPIIFHETRNGSLGHDRFHRNFFFSHMVGRVLETMIASMTLVCGGALERFPELKVILLETGASQMPWWIGRMDEHYEKLPKLVPWLKMKPSEYFQRQVYFGCEPFEDELFDWAVETLGEDRMVLATDLPHWDSSVPAATLGPIVENPKLSETSKRKILGQNAAGLLDL